MAFFPQLALSIGPLGCRNLSGAGG